MTKQEEIREGIKGALEITYTALTEKATDDVLKYLDSQGAVLKVDRELPPFAYVSEQDLNAKTEIQNAILKAGYEAVESLVKK